MGELYHNKLKTNLFKDDVYHPIVKRVLTTNYKKMSFDEFKKAFDDLFDHFEDPLSQFVWLWGAAVVYSKNSGLDKGLVLPELIHYDDLHSFVNFKRVIITECGPLFREFPRLAYMRSLKLESDQEIRELIKFFTDPKNETFLDFWRRADNKDAAAHPSDETKLPIPNTDWVREMREFVRQLDNHTNPTIVVKQEVRDSHE